MKKSGTRSLVQGLSVVAVLAVVAIPLANLMVAQSAAGVTADITTQAAVATPVAEVQASETGSAVSALMAGSAVGPSRGAVLALRHPASAYIP